jgi:peptidyl-Lys metalloendopeptidase
MRKAIVLVIMSLISLSGCNKGVDASTAQASLELRLSIEEASLGEGKVVLKSVLTNNSTQKVSFLPWGTPLDSGVNGHFLSVVDRASDKELVYRGRLVKRRAPTEDDYVVLGASQSATMLLDLSRSYDFCSSTSYLLAFSGQISSFNYSSLPLSFNTIEFSTTNRFPDCI